MAKMTSARETLIDAAVELFRARGYEGVGVAELLARSGAPRGSLYFHFPGGKEQIGAEAIARVGREASERFRALRESGVDLETFVERVFKTTAKESKACDYEGSCPMAAVAADCGCHSPLLNRAVRDAFASWQGEMRLAALGAGMSDKNADVFASAMLAAMEGAFIVSKSERSPNAHINASRAIKALAASLLPN
jgi:TetR/AcrR family transcriptional repressor of lmrAB and yxaGH operons